MSIRRNCHSVPCGGAAALMCVVILSVSLLASKPIAAAPRPFVAGSHSALLGHYGDRAFILSFWSLDCPPCYRELAFWGEQRRQGTLPPLVLVATDSPAAAGEIDALLAEHGLQDVQSWVFAAPAPQLRYEIDRHWQGELPRTYFIDHGRVVEAATGVITAARLRSWNPIQR